MQRGTARYGARFLFALSKLGEKFPIREVHKKGFRDAGSKKPDGIFCAKSVGVPSHGGKDKLREVDWEWRANRGGQGSDNGGCSD